MKGSFQLKLTLLITGAILTTTFIAYLILFNYITNLTLETIRGRLKDVVKTATYLFDTKDRSRIQQLAKQIRNDIDINSVKEKIEALEEGDVFLALPKEVSNVYMKRDSFLKLVQKLRQIKYSSRSEIRTIQYLKQLPPDAKDYPTIQYTYIFIDLDEYPDKSALVFLADADYEAIADEPGSPLGNIYKSSELVFQRAFQGVVSTAESFHKSVYGVFLSGSAPLLDKNGKVIAILGLDYDVSSEANVLTSVYYIFGISLLVIFLFSILISVVFARIIANPVNKLRQVAEKVAQKDFTVQIHIKNRDELGLLANSFNIMINTIRDYAENLEELNKTYYQFVPREFLSYLGVQDIRDIALGKQEEKKMTVLFLDIRSFTSLSENLTPRENFEFINSFLGVMSPIIREFDGFIDKYIGDAIMALFPNVENAILSSIQMRENLVVFNENRQKEKKLPIEFGIGINTGKLILGTVGEEERMDTTVISDVVNVAARLENLTKILKSRIIVSQASYKEYLETREKPFRVNFRLLGNVTVKGKNKTLGICEVVVEDRDLVLSTIEEFEKGIRLFSDGDYQGATQCFSQVLTTNPDDKVADYYYNICKLEVTHLPV